MANNNNDKNGTPTPDQERAHNPGQGELNKGQQKGAPTAGNRDSKTNNPMPASRGAKEDNNSDLGNDKSQQRAPQPGTNRQ